MSGSKGKSAAGCMVIIELLHSPIYRDYSTGLARLAMAFYLDDIGLIYLLMICGHVISVFAE